jgi:hypothetical protein
MTGKPEVIPSGNPLKLIWERGANYWERRKDLIRVESSSTSMWAEQSS